MGVADKRMKGWQRTMVNTIPFLGEKNDKQVCVYNSKARELKFELPDLSTKKAGYAHVLWLGSQLYRSCFNFNFYFLRQMREDSLQNRSHFVPFNPASLYDPLTCTSMALGST